MKKEVKEYDIKTDKQMMRFVLRKQPLHTQDCEKIFGLSSKTISSAIWRAKLGKPETTLKRNLFAYRAMKYLKPAIVEFLMDDKNFNGLNCNLPIYDDFNRRSRGGRKPNVN